MKKSGLIKLLMASLTVTACMSGRGSGTGTNTGMATGTTSSPTASSTTSGSTTTMSGGDVDLYNGGLWSDGTNGGMWMDTTGSMRMGGRGGRMMGLEAADISRMNDQNIVAHLETGDSLEIALSTLAVMRAQNPAVRDFAQRMVDAHTQHMQQGRQLAQQNGITPTPLPGDTIDATMANRMMTRLTTGGSWNGSTSNSGTAAGTTSGTTSGSMAGNATASSDRQIMMAEIAMHRHMLQELTMMQPKATGTARQLVDQTIPVVRQHLSDAQGIWRQLGAGTGRTGGSPDR